MRYLQSATYVFLIAASISVIGMANRNVFVGNNCQSSSDAELNKIAIGRLTSEEPIGIRDLGNGCWVLHNHVTGKQFKTCNDGRSEEIKQ